MSKVAITESHLSDIADAIRGKNGQSARYTPGQMVAAIEAIPTGGAPVLDQLSVTQNGTYTPGAGVDGFDEVVVNVSDGGSSGVYVGKNAPTSDIGSDGEYYYRRTDAFNGFDGVLSNNSSTILSGNEFVTNENITVIGLRGYVRGGTTGRLLIADTSGAIVAEITNISFVAGWNDAFFGTPVQLSANQTYIVMIDVLNTVLKYEGSSNIKFDSAITYVKGRYNSIPGVGDPSNAYGADIIIRKRYQVAYEQYYKTNGSWLKII